MKCTGLNQRFQRLLVSFNHRASEIGRKCKYSESSTAHCKSLMSRLQSTIPLMQLSTLPTDAGFHRPESAWTSITSVLTGVFGRSRISSGKIPICDRRRRYLSILQGISGMRRRNRDNLRSRKGLRGSTAQPVQVASKNSSKLATERSLREA